MTAPTPNARKTVYTGTLSNIQVMEIAGGEPVLSANLIRIVNGEEVILPIAAAGVALESVKELIVEDATASLYGMVVGATFVVLGPDLRRRTLLRQGLPVASKTVADESAVAARKNARRRFFASRQRGKIN